jgi:hypothetical protein
LAEGKIDIDNVRSDLSDLGVAKRTVDNVTNSVAVYSKGTGVAKRTKAQILGSLPVTKGSKVERV